VESVYEHFTTQSLPDNIHLHLFLMPLESKAALVEALDKTLKQWQEL
jgi:hypothetical protein